MYKAAPEHETVRAVVAPAAGRLIVFWSDYRVPHRVKPTTVDRYVKRALLLLLLRPPATTGGRCCCCYYYYYYYYYYARYY